jgi:excisionase family DNA binding protein
MRGFRVEARRDEGAPRCRCGSNLWAGGGWVCSGAVLSRVRVGGVSTRLLTAAEVAAVLGVPKTWVYEQSRAGRIPTVPLGRYRRFRPEAITAWVEELERRGDRPGV